MFDNGYTDYCRTITAERNDMKNLAATNPICSCMELLEFDEIYRKIPEENNWRKAHQNLLNSFR